MPRGRSTATAYQFRRRFPTKVVRMPADVAVALEECAERLGITVAEAFYVLYQRKTPAAPRRDGGQTDTTNS